MAIEWRLGALLAERGMTAYGLAQLTGLSIPSCYELAKPDVKRIKLETLDRLCVALHCEPSDLLVHVAAKRKR